jgi:hypothetical protein
VERLWQDVSWYGVCRVLLEERRGMSTCASLSRAQCSIFAPWLRNNIDKFPEDLISNRVKLNLKSKEFLLLLSNWHAQAHIPACFLENAGLFRKGATARAGEGTIAPPSVRCVLTPAYGADVEHIFAFIRYSLDFAAAVASPLVTYERQNFVRSRMSKVLKHSSERRRLELVNQFLLSYAQRKRAELASALSARRKYVSRASCAPRARGGGGLIVSTRACRYSEMWHPR